MCVYDAALNANKLIDFVDPVRPELDCIEHLWTRKLVHCLVVSLLFANKSLTSLVIEKEVLVEGQFPWFPMRNCRLSLCPSCLRDKRRDCFARVRQRADVAAV